MNYDRQMKGEDLDELSVEELSQLERQIDKAYTRIRRVKEQKLMECNGKLKQKVTKTGQRTEVHFTEKQLGFVTNCEQTHTQNNVAFDTSLRLGFV
ncbi:hypothetical protein KSS87_001399 [Heliosperma pusillum]|nr:hypothetical protein KSS87_001399 [Heliosperma pusillum]